MTKKAFALVSIALLALLIVAGCASDVQYSDDRIEVRVIHASVYLHGTADSLFDAATQVARMEVLDERTELINRWAGDEVNEGLPAMYDVYTINTVKILEVFKGRHEIGDIIEIIQLGGLYGNLHLITHMTPLPAGSEIILFFDDNGAGPDHPSRLHSAIEGAYQVPSAPARRGSSIQDVGVLQAYSMGEVSAGETFDGLNESNDLVFTIGDLVRLTNAESSRQ